MKPLLLWMILAQAGDITTTAIGLQHGCQEAMLFKAHPYVGLTVKAGGTWFASVTLPLVAERRPKLGKGLMLTAAVSGTAATVWNVRQIEKGCRR